MCGGGEGGNGRGEVEVGGAGGEKNAVAVGKRVKRGVSREMRE